VEQENLVKKTCRELGITQKELAEKIGVSRQTIYDWSSGKTPIPNWGFKIFQLLSENRKFTELKNALKNTFQDKQTIIFQ
jgi:DNA-binding XRE family transcriptional regulator